MAQVAVLFPSVVVTVTSAAPAATPVTSPVSDTFAIPVSVLNHVTVLSVASAGSTVAVSVSFAATARDSVVLFNATPVTALRGCIAFRCKFLSAGIKCSLDYIPDT